MNKREYTLDELFAMRERLWAPVKLAHLIKIRHACDCDTALQPPGEHGVEHTFEIDGQPFPWYLDETGPRIRQVGSLYVVDTPILCTHIDAIGTGAHDMG